MVKTRSESHLLLFPDKEVLFCIDETVEQLALSIYEHLLTIKSKYDVQIIEGIVPKISEILTTLNDKCAIISELENEISDMKMDRAQILNKLKSEKNRIDMILEESFNVESETLNIEGTTIVRENHDLKEEI